MRQAYIQALACVGRLGSRQLGLVEVTLDQRSYPSCLAYVVVTHKEVTTRRVIQGDTGEGLEVADSIIKQLIGAGVLT